MRHFTRPKNNDGEKEQSSQITQKFEKYPFFSTHTGWFCMRGRRESSDITEKLGLGTSLYFKQLKSLTLLFLLFTILNLPAFIFFYKGSVSEITSTDPF